LDVDKKIVLEGLSLQSEIAPSRGLAAKLIYAAFKILKENNGQMPGKEILSQIERKVDLDDWAKEKYEKSGYVRWKSILRFFSIDCVKAGFLVKKKGIWYLTDEGEESIKLGELGLLKEANSRYKAWTESNVDKELKDESEIPQEKSEKLIEAELDDIEGKAFDRLKEYISEKNPYEFQDLCAALLRGMGYYTPFVAPRGKDGGIDIIAYKDPLGAESPRFKVQVKHRNNPASVPEVRQLIGVLQKNGDVGIFISSGGFTPDATKEARGALVHIELIDLSRLLDLWQQFYPKLLDEDRSLLPLRSIYFLLTSQI
jgi:restriction system protein